MKHAASKARQFGAISLAAFASSLAAIPAHAQASQGGPVPAPDPQAEAANSSAEGQHDDQQQGDAEQEAADEIIVTGVARRTLKIESTNTVNVLDREQIERLAPISTADLLQNVPGIYAEGSTAGEASNNITVRGLPVTGGFRYAPQLFDGLPWYEEPEVQFMNNDVAVRHDLMTERIEVVKGGTGGILYSNGLGATVNHITVTGGQTYRGGYRLELADYGFVRNEALLAGPITDNLTFAVGGFYRFSDGLRDTGYRADDGGQVRANLLYRSDDDSLRVFAQAHVINDRTGFYQNVPIQVPRLSKPGTADEPVRIDQDTIRPIGIDFAHGTVASSFNRVFTQLGEYGRREIDLADGIHADFDIFTVKVDKSFGEGWGVSAGVRHTSGTSDFNAMFTGNDTTTTSAFNFARYQNDVVSPAHGAALSCNLNSAKLQGFFAVPATDPCAAFAGISRQDFINNYAIAQSVGAFYLHNGQRVPDSTFLNFLLPFITQAKAKSTSADLRLTKAVELMGSHELTFGAYGSAYSSDQNFQSSLLVSTMEDKPALADLRALDANGNPVGPSLTLDGGILPGFFGYVSDMSGDGRALYVLDHWETLNNRLKVDVGVRWQKLKATVTRMDRVCCTNVTPASVVPGSAGDTTADNEVFMPGPRRVLEDDFDGFGFSVGANYSIAPSFAVYGLTSRSFRLPSLEDLNEFRVSSSAEGSQVEEIWQYEGGVRFDTRTFDGQIALFLNRFEPRQQVNVFRDFTSPQCAVAGGVPDINTCPEVRQTFARGVKNKGVELELGWRPPFVPGLELRAGGVLQDPRIQGANFTIVDANVDQNGVVTSYEFVQVGENGRRPRRLATKMFNFQPVFDLKPLTGLPIKPYAKYTYFSSRFSESTDFNVTLYPSYYHIDGGVIVDLNDRLALQVHAANITNQLSFTEGDPLFFDLLGPNGDTNRGVARPLFGRTVRGSLTYRF